MNNDYKQKVTGTTRHSRFANPKLTEIADSFNFRSPSVWRSLGSELLAYLSLVGSIIVLGSIMQFIMSMLSIALFALSNRSQNKFETYYLVAIAVSYTSAGYVCYSLIGKYFFRIRRRAKKLRLNALAALTTRSDDPILYLRSFADDERVNPRSRLQKTYEEDLALALNHIGPVIAIGGPGSDESIGATRIYLKPDTWQDNVRRLMQISQLIVIQAGQTEGLLWELEAALEDIDSRKVIISFLPWYHLRKRTRHVEYEKFKSHVKDFMHRSPSPVTIELPADLGNAVFIVFSRNWQPELIEISTWKKWVYRFSSSLAVTEALRPVLQRRDLKLSSWKNLAYLILISWLFFGFGWTIVGFRLGWMEHFSWFNLATFISFIIVLAWLTPNIFLFFFLRLVELIRWIVRRVMKIVSVRLHPG